MLFHKDKTLLFQRGSVENGELGIGSAAAQDVETQIIKNNNHQGNQSGFYCQIDFLRGW